MSQVTTDEALDLDVTAEVGRRAVDHHGHVESRLTTVLEQLVVLVAAQELGERAISESPQSEALAVSSHLPDGGLDHLANQGLGDTLSEQGIILLSGRALPVVEDEVFERVEDLVGTSLLVFEGGRLREPLVLAAILVHDRERATKQDARVVPHDVDVDRAGRRVDSVEVGHVLLEHDLHRSCRSELVRSLTLVRALRLHADESSSTALHHLSHAETSLELHRELESLAESHPRAVLQILPVRLLLTSLSEQVRDCSSVGLFFEDRGVETADSCLQVRDCLAELGARYTVAKTLSNSSVHRGHVAIPRDVRCCVATVLLVEDADELVDALPSLRNLVHPREEIEERPLVGTRESEEQLVQTVVELVVLQLLGLVVLEAVHLRHVRLQSRVDEDRELRDLRILQQRVEQPGLNPGVAVLVLRAEDCGELRVVRGKIDDSVCDGGILLEEEPEVLFGQCAVLGERRVPDRLLNLAHDGLDLVTDLPAESLALAGRVAVVVDTEVEVRGLLDRVDH